MWLAFHSGALVRFLPESRFVVSRYDLGALGTFLGVLLPKPHFSGCLSQKERITAAMSDRPEGLSVFVEVIVVPWYLVHGYNRICCTFEMTQQSRIHTSAGELLVPEGDPFQSDLLGRERPCKLLTNLVTRVNGPCTIAIDAAWGNGKTTFLRLWAAHLRQNDFSVIEVNAWKTDYFKDAFLAIVGELTKQLEESNPASTRNGIELSSLKKCFTVLITVASHLAASRVGLTGENVASLVDVLKSDASRLLEQYEEQLASVEAFRSELEKVARDIRDETGKPLIVLIDELDRCRPTYAVEFLEVVKHLMSVNHVVYVFAMNRSELAHAVSGCYGPEFDGSGYLRRFFDIDLKLPLPSRESFIRSIVKELELTTLIPDQAARLLQAFLGVDTIGLRQVQQALFRLRMALAFAGPNAANYPDYVKDFCVALILREYDQEILGEFLRGDKSDLEVVEILLPVEVKDEIHLLDQRLVFETTIIRAAQEVVGVNELTQRYDTTPLLESYSEVHAATSTDRYTDEERDFAGRIVTYISRTGSFPRSFKSAVEYLEVPGLLMDFH